jgi:hypothetical protein
MIISFHESILLLCETYPSHQFSQVLFRSKDATTSRFLGRRKILLVLKMSSRDPSRTARFPSIRFLPSICEGKIYNSQMTSDVPFATGKGISYLLDPRSQNHELSFTMNECFCCPVVFCRTEFLCNGKTRNDAVQEHCSTT